MNFVCQITWLRRFSLEKLPLFIFAAKLFWRLLYWVIAPWSFAFSLLNSITFCLDAWSIYCSHGIPCLSCFWPVTTSLVWRRLLTSLHMASLVISFASPNFICSSEKHSHFTEVPPQWHKTDKGRYKSLWKRYCDAGFVDLFNSNKIQSKRWTTQAEFPWVSNRYRNILLLYASFGNKKSQFFLKYLFSAS